jgi:anti-sigma factor RsiW
VEKCSSTQAKVEIALLEGGSLPAPLQAHLDTCPSCTAEAASLQTLISALQARPAPVVPADLTARLVPVVMAAAQQGRRQGALARLLRPVAAFATAFGVVLATLAAAGSALVVSAALTAGGRTPATQIPASQPATEAPATQTPATTPATPAPATEAPAETSTPVATPTPEPADVPRRTPEPVSPDPSEGIDPTAPTEGTSP